MNERNFSEPFRVHVSTDGGSSEGDELWSAANQARKSAEETLSISIKPVTSRGTEDVKTGVIEGVIVLVGLGVAATRPLQRFIIDLLKELRLRGTRKIKIKMPGFEFDYQGQKMEELEEALKHVVERRSTPPSTQIKGSLSGSADLEIIVDAKNKK
jgi:hypothetical protein